MADESSPGVGASSRARLDLFGSRALLLLAFSCALSARAEDQGQPAEPALIPVGQEAPLPNPKRPPEAVELENIIVTASKREQNQRDVAGSVEAFDGEELEAFSAQGLGDYLKQVPGVVLLERGTDSAYPIIRGIASSTAQVGVVTTQLPVGIYIDDMPFNDLYLPALVPDLHPFDLARVEVLKGPQGTLFGSGSLAGAIRYVTQQPKLEEWESKLSTSLRSNQHSEGLSSVVAVAQNLPIGSDAALRLAGHYRDTQGMVDEVDREDDVDRRRQYSGRLQGRWELSERLGLSAFFIGQQSVQANLSSTDFADRFERELGGHSRRESRFSGSNVSLNYAFDSFDFLSSSNFLSKNASNDGMEPFGAAPIAEGDGSGVNGPGTEDAGKTDTLLQQAFSDSAGWFQEFRLRSPEGGGWWLGDRAEVQWLAGLAYQDTGQDVVLNQESNDASVLAGPIEALPLFPLDTPQGPVSGSQDVSLVYGELNSNASELAAFAEAEIRLGESWSLGLGGRAFKTKLTAKGFISGSQNLAFDGGRTQTPIDRVVRAQGFNPKLNLRYLFSENLQFYALAAKGFQFGGVQFNPSYPALVQTNPNAFEHYRSSKLWNFELGLRSEFFQQRLRFDLTAYYLDWSDLQITVREPIFPESDSLGLSLRYIANIGEARSKGIEALLLLRPWSWLQWSSSAAWQRAATAVGFEAATGYVESGTPLPGSPEFQISNQLQLTAPAHWPAQPVLSLMHNYVGESFNDLHRSETQGGYHNLDLHLALQAQGSRIDWRLALGVLNLSDQRGISAVAGARDAREIDYFITPPRTLLLTLAGQW